MRVWPVLVLAILGAASAARFLLLLGGLSVLAVVPLGYAAAAGVTYPPETAANLGWHRLLGTTGGALLLAATILREWGRLRAGPLAVRASRVVLLAAALSIAIAGYHGGVLVYGRGHFAW